MKNVLALGFLTLLGLTLSPALAQNPTPAPATTVAPTPEPTPPGPLRDKITQVLPDRNVTFRLLAPKANAVDVILGIKSGPYEPQGSTTAAMTRMPTASGA
jgi:hypothetical protein